MLLQIDTQIQIRAYANCKVEQKKKFKSWDPKNILYIFSFISLGYIIEQPNKYATS